MKNLAKFLLLICCLWTVGMTTASAQKVGHINSIEVLSSMDEWKAAQKNWETYAKQLQTSLENQEKSLISDYEAFVKRVESGGVTPAEQQKKGAEFQQRQLDLEKAQMKAQQDIVKREGELTNPIRDKVLNAIEAVAKENSFLYIFDTSVGAILYAADSEDVSSKVRAKL